MTKPVIMVGDRVFASDDSLSGKGTLRFIQANHYCIEMDEACPPYTWNCDGLTPSERGRWYKKDQLTIEAGAVDTAEVASYYHALVSYAETTEQP